MGRTRWAAGLLGGCLAVSSARAGDEDAPSLIERLDPVVLQLPDPPKKDVPKGPPAKDVPKAKDPKEAPPAKDPAPDAFARATDMSGEAPASSFSRMMGDLMGGIYADRFITVPAYQSTTSTLFVNQTFVRLIQQPDLPPLRVVVTVPVPAGTITNVVPTTVTTRAQVPILGRGAFKISENERPVPEDRFILTYNVFGGVPGGILGPGPTATIVNPGTTTTNTAAGGPFVAAPVMSSPVAGAPPVAVAVQTITLNGQPAVVRTLIPNPDSTVHRQVVGFEKTFFSGAASFGVRAPFFQQRGQGDGSVSADDFGDMTFVLKYLALTNGTDGISVGLAVTAPTGPPIPTIAGDIHSSLIQPFVGGVFSAGDFFVLGFSSVAIPVDSRDTTLGFVDLGFGFTAYRGGPGSLVTFVNPVTEAHLTSALENRNGGGLINVPDLVVITQGLQIGFGPATTVNLGVGVPVTGPRPFNLEGMVQFNLRF